MRIEFTVHGTPQPQGSAKAFIPKGWNRAVVTSDNAKLKPWRQEVAGTARQVMVMAGLEPFQDAVSVTCSFWFPRPKSLAKRVTQKTTKPDCDKLLRAALDSLTGIVFRDDAQVVGCHVSKSFADAPGTRIVVESVPVGVGVNIRHGIDCQKVPHLMSVGGYLHGPEDDTPYYIDGCSYCGRCHLAL